MSESAQETRSRILDRARVLYNEHGIDNVGVRDLARDLGLSPGNVSYWFPRKEDLVRALLENLRDRGGARPRGDTVGTVPDLLLGFRSALLAQLEYRCLTESIVHVTRTWPDLAPFYRKVERRRRQELAGAVRALSATGALLPVTDADVARLVATWTLVARFWMAERGVSLSTFTDEEAVGHYVALVGHSLLPYVSEAQRSALAPFLSGTLIDASLGMGAVWAFDPEDGAAGEPSAEAAR